MALLMVARVVFVVMVVSLLVALDRGGCGRLGGVVSLLASVALAVVVVVAMAVMVLEVVAWP